MAEEVDQKGCLGGNAQSSLPALTPLLMGFGVHGGVRLMVRERGLENRARRSATYSVTILGNTAPMRSQNAVVGILRGVKTPCGTLHGLEALRLL